MFPKLRTTSETLVIKAKPELVYRYVSDFSLWFRWNMQQTGDLRAKNYIEGKMGEVGSFWNWDGPSVGKGSIKVDSINEAIWFSYDVQQYKPQRYAGSVVWQFAADTTGCVITRIDTCRFAYPLGRWRSLLSWSKIVSAAHTEMQQLKAYCEQKNDDGQ